MNFVYEQNFIQSPFQGYKKIHKRDIKFIIKCLKKLRNVKIFGRNTHKFFGNFYSTEVETFVKLLVFSVL